tara:strand:+ start:82 stop:492 length:411 start_codon:yes stop_codon:yes gene_type:complete
MKTELKVMPSLQRKIDGLKELAEQQVERKLVDIAQTAVDLSPVDTGAYVTSFSFSTGAGRPRGKSSKGKARTNPQAARNEGLSNLIKDLERIPSLLDTTSIVLRNNSPHAVAVEYGGRGWKTSPYFVFTKLRNIYG